MDHIRLAVQKAGPTRTETLMGREFRVFPAVLVREQVLNNNLGRTFLPAEEIRASVEAWNAIPVVIRHPTKRGYPISARAPEVMNSTGVGFLFRAQYDSESRALKADVFLDPSRTETVEGASDAVNNVDQGNVTELSTGFGTNIEAVPGTFDGAEYDVILRGIVPDHLALLPDETGACSVKDGCGLGVNHAGDCQMEAGAEGDADPALPAPPTDVTPEAAANDSAWKRFLTAAARFLGLRPTENQSDEDRRNTLTIALRGQFGGEDRYVWVESVFSDESEVVFEVEVQDGGEGAGLFRASYEIADDGSVTFGEPAKVRRVTTFEPAANAGGNREGDTMNRDQMIAHLAEAGTDREALNKLSDCQLKALMGATTTANNQTGGEVEAWRKAHAYKAELDALRAETESAVNMEKTIRAQLVDDILYSQNRAYSDEEVLAMDIVALRKLHQTMFPEPKSYAGRGGPRSQNVGPSFDFVRPILGGGEKSVLARKEAN